MESTETTPLLEDADLPFISPENDSVRASFLPVRLMPSWSPVQRRVMIATALLMFFLNGGNYLSIPPQLQIIEDIICKNHQQKLDSDVFHVVKNNGSAIDESNFCKSPAVQSELALVMGWKYTFDILPSVALALPYGVLADKIGRRPVLMMSLGSLMAGETWTRVVCWFNLPIRLLWISGLFQVPGGGELVAMSMLLTIIADTFAPEERSTMIFRLTAMSFLAELIVTPVSAWMLEKLDPWFPYLIGLGIMICCSTASFFIPETLDLMRAKHNSQEDALEGDDDDDSDAMDSQELDDFVPPLIAGKKRNVMGTIFGRMQDFISSSRFIWAQPRVLVTVLAVFAGSLDKSSWYLLIQYISAKFHCRISVASLLICVRGLMILCVLLIIVPLFARFMLHRLHYSAVQKDLVLARIAAASAIIGYFLIFVAPSAPLFLVGTFFVALSLPFVGSLLAAATTFVTSKNQIATLSVAMTVSRSMGNVIAGPLFAYLYTLGMRLGLEWSGLPFATASLIFLVTIIPILCMRA